MQYQFGHLTVPSAALADAAGVPGLLEDLIKDRLREEITRSAQSVPQTHFQKMATFVMQDVIRQIEAEQPQIIDKVKKQMTDHYGSFYPFITIFSDLNQGKDSNVTRTERRYVMQFLANAVAAYQRNSFDFLRQTTTGTAIATPQQILDMEQVRKVTDRIIGDSPAPEIVFHNQKTAKRINQDPPDLNKIHILPDDDQYVLKKIVGHTLRHGVAFGVYLQLAMRDTGEALQGDSFLDRLREFLMSMTGYQSGYRKTEENLAQIDPFFTAFPKQLCGKFYDRLQGKIASISFLEAITAGCEGRAAQMQDGLSRAFAAEMIGKFSDSELENLPPDKRSYLIQILTGRVLGYEGRPIAEWYPSEQVQAARLVQSLSMGASFKKVFHDAALAFMQTNPEQKLKYWSSYNWNQQKAMIRTVFKDLQASWRKATGESFFDEGNLPFITHEAARADGTNNFILYADSANGHQGHNVWLNFDLLRRDHQTLFSKIDGKKVPTGYSVSYPYLKKNSVFPCYDSESTAKRKTDRTGLVIWMPRDKGLHSLPQNDPNSCWDKSGDAILETIIDLYFKSLTERFWTQEGGDRFKATIMSEAETADIPMARGCIINPAIGIWNEFAWAGNTRSVPKAIKTMAFGDPRSNLPSRFLTIGRNNTLG